MTMTAKEKTVRGTYTQEHGNPRGEIHKKSRLCEIELRT